MDEKSWDDPRRCAKFIERFTSHDLVNGSWLELGSFSRKDLEGIVQLLYGYYTAVVLDSPPELGDALRCTAEDVMRAMSMASWIGRSDSGEIVLDDELWDLTRRSPVLLRYFIELQVL
ncbi:MAG: hypothetical protein NWF14_03395 [Candidatus Bathyarchaeota archaeon]|nr:hypothetical protein [Candidatus Bathyarchaeota archaeon]